MHYNSQAYHGTDVRLGVPTAKRYVVPVLSLTVLLALTTVFAPSQAEARRRHHRRAAHHSSDYVANEGNRAAALEILSSEKDPSRLTAASAHASASDGASARVAGLSAHAGGIVEDPSSDAGDAGDDGNEEGGDIGQPTPWDAHVSSSRAPTAHDAAGPRELRFKSESLTSEQLENLSLQKIQHSLSRTSRKRCSKKTCNKQLRHYVVQFNERITAQDQLDVTSLGATILRYMPDDAYVIESEAVVAYTIRGSATSVKAVIPYQAKWKISRELQPAMRGEAGSGSARREVRVRLFPTEDGREAARLIEEIAGVKVLTVSGRSLLLELANSRISDVAAIEAVEWLEDQAQVHLLAGANASGPRAADANPSFTIQSQTSTRGDAAELSGWESGTKLLHASKAWDRGLNGQGQIIAMADSGLDTGDVNHLPADLAGHVLEGSIFSERSKSWADLFGHGTYLAGLMVGNGAGLGGRITGVATGAHVLPQSIWDAGSGLLAVPARLRDLFLKAYQAGARIHLDAWGSSAHSGEYSIDAQQVDEFAEMNPDMLIVFAAGNSGQDADHDGRVDSNSIVSPATAKNALTVGASKNFGKNSGQSSNQTGALGARLRELDGIKAGFPAEPLASSRLSDNEKGLAPFGSRGPTDDGRIKPEIVAPATNLLSLRSRAMSQTPAAWTWGSFGQSYVWSGGSSDAAALTASSAAVVRQYLIENRKIKNPSSALLKAVLMHSAFDLFPGEFGEHGAKRGQEILTARPNADEGFGRVDLNKATDLGEALIVDDHAGLGPGETHAYKIRISSKTKLSATLVYTDTPAALGAAKVLVNDLDLVLIDKDGHETTIGDHTNNFESLTRDLTAGNYQIQVRGYNVPQAPNGKQPYALIVSVD